MQQGERPTRPSPARRERTTKRSRDLIQRSAPIGRAAIVLMAALLACLAFTCLAQAEPVKHKNKGTEVKVMTRNLYLGADLSPAIQAPSTEAFIEANGGILRQVEATNFPV